MKVLLLGDSWAAAWSSKFNEYPGWPNLLSEKFDITNIAQAGVSQYSIVKQLNSVNPDDFDRIVISITSPFRIYTPQHPVHKTGLHANADLMLNDLQHQVKKFPDNAPLRAAVGFFEHHFDTDHANFVNQLIVDHLLQHLDKDKTIVTSVIQHCGQFVKSHEYCDGFEVWKKHKADNVNHMTQTGNEIFALKMEKNLSH